MQIGCDIETSKQAIALARRFPGIFYATVGYHPETAQDTNIQNSEFKIQDFEQLVRDNRDVVVAIGETGFDHHYLDGAEEIGDRRQEVDQHNLSSKARKQIENQKWWWLAQWELARKYDLPLVIHTRDAAVDTADFMIANNINRAVIHCYSEDP